MTFDYRASQLRTSKIIASGSTGTGAKLLLYPIDSQGTPLNQGNISAALFGTGSIGNDVFLFVSGAIGSINGSSNGASVFGGDVYVSGNLKSAGTITGSEITATTVKGVQFIGENSPDFYFYVASARARFNVYSSLGGGIVDFRSQGNISFQDGTAFSGTLSSSLTGNRLWQLPDGSGDVTLTNRILAGPNTTINTYAGGYVAITGSSGASTTWIASGSSLKTTSSVAISSDDLYADAHGTDIAFYVSGSGSQKSVFGGTVHFSGTVESAGDFGPIKTGTITTFIASPTGLVWQTTLSDYEIQNINLSLVGKQTNNANYAKFSREFTLVRTTGSVAFADSVNAYTPDFQTTGSWGFSLILSASSMSVYVTGSMLGDVFWKCQATVNALTSN
jgi:hypothetical protein